MADLKELKTEVRKARDTIAKGRPKGVYIYADYEKDQLEEKYPSLLEQISKLSKSQKQAAGFTFLSGFPHAKYGAVPGYPAKGGKGTKFFSSPPLTWEEREKRRNKRGGGKIKKNYAKGGGVRPTSY